MGPPNHLPPRVVIAAPQGRSGKSLISIGLCNIFQGRGLKVQPFKRGPDYIDSSWLTAAAGRSCHNLDMVLMSEDVLKAVFHQACRSATMAIIEGTMGLYDGERGSTASIACLLGSPVILVVNAARMTQSIAAMVNGFQNFQQGINIGGVILNNVAGSRHEQKLVAAVEQNCGIPVVGSVPKEMLNITEQHFGLVPYYRNGGDRVINNISQQLERCLNLDWIFDIARTAKVGWIEEEVAPPVGKEAQVKLGVMFDQVFTFYYPENLEALARAGAELVFIDSLTDQVLPEIDALYIGGGFPEMFLEELEANKQLHCHLADAIEDGLPVYAEGAGLVYLSQGIHWNGQRYSMVGALPIEVEICSRPQNHGYVLVEIDRENPLFPIGSTFWGHEFHCFKLRDTPSLELAYKLKRGQGINGAGDGIVYKNVLAAYTQVHAARLPQWAENFVSLALRRRCLFSALQS